MRLSASVALFATVIMLMFPGAAVEEEVDDMKQKFEVEFGGSLEKLADYWPGAFRWRCCGMSVGEGEEGHWGCDHHGDLACPPCKCDFCRGGKPVPASIHNERATHGLQLRRGPDPRSGGGGFFFGMR